MASLSVDPTARRMVMSQNAIKQLRINGVRVLILCMIYFKVLFDYEY